MPSGGGDLIYLSKILQQSIYQLEQLRKITGTNEETLRLLRDTNRGLHEAMYVGDTVNRTLKAGTFSKLRSLNEKHPRCSKAFYGRIPKTSEAQLQKKTDLTVAESLHLCSSPRFTGHKHGLIIATPSIIYGAHHSKSRMRSLFVILFKPTLQQPQGGLCIRAV